MFINKYKKQANGQYKVTMEDGSIILVHEDLILKYDLLLTKNIDEDLKEKIQIDNLVYIAYDLALKYLSKKMRTTLEIREYLKKSKVDDALIEDTISLLLSKKMLDDKYYAKLYIDERIRLYNDGPNKIKESLNNLGIKDDVVSEYICAFTEDIQLDKIKKIVEKMLKTNRNKSVMMLKNKIIKYLVGLGYNSTIVNEILKDTNIVSDNDIAKKEHAKIYNKLSKKYSGKELEYKIRQKMYALGFSDYVGYEE